MCVPSFTMTFSFTTYRFHCEVVNIYIIEIVCTMQQSVVSEKSNVYMTKIYMRCDITQLSWHLIWKNKKKKKTTIIPRFGAKCENTGKDKESPCSYH